MKNVTNVLADAPTTSLKLAYSYLLPVLDILPTSGSSMQGNNAKKSVYKSLFVVHPEIKNAVTWDVEWFANYE